MHANELWNIQESQSYTSDILYSVNKETNDMEALPSHKSKRTCIVCNERFGEDQDKLSYTDDLDYKFVIHKHCRPQFERSINGYINKSNAISYEKHKKVMESVMNTHRERHNELRNDLINKDHEHKISGQGPRVLNPISLNPINLLPIKMKPMDIVKEQPRTASHGVSSGEPHQGRNKDHQKSLPELRLLLGKLCDLNDTQKNMQQQLHDLYKHNDGPTSWKIDPDMILFLEQFTKQVFSIGTEVIAKINEMEHHYSQLEQPLSDETQKPILEHRRPPISPVPSISSSSLERTHEKKKESVLDILRAHMSKRVEVDEPILEPRRPPISPVPSISSSSLERTHEKKKESALDMLRAHMRKRVEVDETIPNFNEHLTPETASSFHSLTHYPTHANASSFFHYPPHYPPHYLTRADTDPNFDKDHSTKASFDADDVIRSEQSYDPSEQYSTRSEQSYDPSEQDPTRSEQSYDSSEQFPTRSDYLSDLSIGPRVSID